MRSYLLRLSYAKTKFYDFSSQLSVHQSHLCLQFIQRYFHTHKKIFQNWLHPKSFKKVSLCSLVLRLWATQFNCKNLSSCSLFSRSTCPNCRGQSDNFSLYPKKRTLAKIRGIATNLCQFWFKQLKVGAGILYSTFNLARLMSVFPG